MSITSALSAILTGSSENHLLPFFWQHGEDEATLRRIMAAIDHASCKAVCVESRPHPDFCGPGWWSTMDVILDEARKRQMRVWILDDSHFPTGFANGAVRHAPYHLCRQSIVFNEQLLVSASAELELNLRTAGLMNPPRPNMDDPGQAFAARQPIGRHFDPDSDRLLTVQAVFPDGNTVDLLDHVQGTTLYWKKPQGICTLQVITATHNAGSHRDYINMMESASVQLLINAVYQPHWEHYSDDFGTTIAGFFSDEPELGNGFLYARDNTLGTIQDLPWSTSLETMLATTFGSGWQTVLPRLFMPDNSDAAAHIRILYMDCVTRLVRSAFSEQLSGWCHEHGVQYIGHIIEDNGQHCRTGSSLGHYFRSLHGQDMAGIDDIGGQVLPQGEDEPTTDVRGRLRNGTFYHYALGKLAQSAAVIDPHKHGRSICEIFGNYGWCEGVRLEKYLVDHFLVRGITDFVPHAFSGAPFPDPDCPPHFFAHGNNPQFRHFGALMAYTNRVATLSTAGRHTASVAVLYHAESEWCDPSAMPFEQVLRPLYDNQIDCHILPADIFSDPDFYHTILGVPLLVNDQAYSAFLVPGALRICTAASQGLATLAQLGLTVLFVEQRPSSLCEGGPLPAVLQSCPVLEATELPAFLRNAGIAAPQLTPSNDRLRILRIEADLACLFVVNEGVNTYDGNLLLPEKATDCFWYDPWFNRCEPATWTITPTGLHVHMHIVPLQSRFLVLGPPPTPLYFAPHSGNEIPLTDWYRSTCRSIDYPHFGIRKKVTLPDMLATEQPEFSGFIRYENVFSLEESEALILTISDACEGVEVFLNGQSAGLQIVAPFRYELFAHAGVNHLAIEVATTLERECYPLLDAQRKRLTSTPHSGSGITGIVHLQRQT